MKTSLLITTLVSLATTGSLPAADVYKEPHGRYLIVDMTLGGSPDYYRKRAHGAIPAVALKEWEAGVRLVNSNQFERRRIQTPYGASMRVVFKGTEDTATGADQVLTSDLEFEQAPVWRVLTDLTLGRPLAHYEAKKSDQDVVHLTLAPTINAFL